MHFVPFLVLFVCACTAARPWSMDVHPRSGRVYATWQGVDGVFEITTSPIGAVYSGSVCARRLGTAVPTSPSGIALLDDTQLGATLMYVTQRTDGRIMRYTLDESSGALVDPTVMLSSVSKPEAIAIDWNQERICVALDTASIAASTARCYRSERSQGIDQVDEWWYNIGHFQYGAGGSSAPETPDVLDALCLDANGTGGVLWIDRAWETTRRAYASFALDSGTEAAPLEYFSGSPASAGAKYIVLQGSPGAAPAALLDERFELSALPSMRVVEWVSGQPRVAEMDPVLQQVGSALFVRATFWLAAQNFTTAGLSTGSECVPFDRSSQAAAFGHTATPSPSPTMLPSHSIHPSFSHRPTSFPSESSFQLPSANPTQGHNASVDMRHHGHDHTKQKVLTGVLVPLFGLCCICACIVLAVCVVQRVLPKSLYTRYRNGDDMETLYPHEMTAGDYAREAQSQGHVRAMRDNALSPRSNAADTDTGRLVAVTHNE